MRPICRAKQRWISIGCPKIVKVWICDSDRFLALPKLIHGPAFVVHDYLDTAMENKSDFWFKIIPKNEEETDNDDISVNCNLHDNHEFVGEVKLSSDDTENYPCDLEDSSLEDQFLHEDGVDL